jgi:type II secretion system protein E
MMNPTQAQLGQILVEMGKLDPDSLDMALREHHKTGERIGSLLVKMGLANEEDVLRALSRQLHIPFVKPSELTLDEKLKSIVPAQIAEHYRLIPIEIKDGMLRVAVNDPLDIHTLDDLRLALRMEIEPVISTRDEIDKAYNRFYGIGGATLAELEKATGEESRTIDVEVHDVEDIDQMAEDASIVRFVNQVIQEAFRDRATDIHIEPLEKELRIRYRIDGVLYEQEVPPAIKRFQSAIISRVKIMADLNIAERRLPQDGKIKIKMGEKDYDLRVSTVPTPYGESIAVRILSRDSELCTIDRLGFHPGHQTIIRDLIKKPHGIILITGPTGSGKSTTLYAALSEINDPDVKIITIEDPIEYRIHGTTQIQVNPQIDLTFARILRTVLRQDPDIIMVGETRDSETAKITIQTALTGHLVFSTLHTNDASSAVTRLEDMGVEPFLISSSVEGIIAQRLVRVLCPECKTPTRPDPVLVRQVNVTREDIEPIIFYRPVGCEACRYTGYRGRTAVLEMVKMNEELRRRIVAGDPANELKRIAIRHGMEPIRHDGWRKIKNGVTTIEEVINVTMEDEFTEELRAMDESTPTQAPAAQPVAATK